LRVEVIEKLFKLIPLETLVNGGATDKICKGSDRYGWD